MKNTLSRLVLGVTTIAVMTIAALCVLTTQYSFKEESTIADAAKAVVHIGVSKRPNPQINTIGSGVIVTKDGYVLTAKHNLRNAQHIFVKTSDGQAFKVLYYVADAHRDLAVLKINVSKKDKLTVAKLGNSEKLRPGQTIYAVGYPAPHLMLDNAPTVSRGVISVVNRRVDKVGARKRSSENSDKKSEEDVNKTETNDLEFRTLEPRGKSRIIDVPVVPLIQFDAMVNPGSSGGALFTENGEFVGVVQAMLTSTGGNEGLNFAIPVNWASLILRGKEATE